MDLLPAVVGCEEELGRGTQSGLVNRRRPPNESDRLGQAKLVICDQPIDITYVPLADGFAYLVAVMEWYSRYVLSWRLSNTADGNFVREALDAALARGVPEIFNTDQGTQFTAAAFVERVQEAGARVSMDGRGRALDNVFIERLWRSVKHEHVYLYDYGTVREADAGLARYFRFYHECRRHQGLGGRTPAEVYFGRRVAPVDNGERLKRIIAVLNN